MVHAFVAFVASQTSQFGKTGANSAPWDTLWVFVGSVAFVLVVVVAGVILNRREAQAARDGGLTDEQ